MQLPTIPFELILLFLFFVLPALGNLLRRRGGQNQGDPKKEGDKPSPPNRPAQAQTAAPQDTPREAPSTAPEWLAEAQRRVAEARRQETQGQQTSSSRTSTSPPSPARSPAQQPARPLVTQRPKMRPEPRRSLEGASLEGRSTEMQRGLGQTSLEGTSLERSSRETPSTFSNLTEAPPLRTQRLMGSKRATITGQELRFDAHDLAKGLIWHQVLSPPRSTLRRTRLSRRRP